MSKYIFLSMPAHGHVNPTLAVVQELVARGEDVTYYLTEEWRPTIEATGAKFHPYHSEFFANMQSPLQGNFSGAMGAMPMQMVKTARDILPQVLDNIRKEQPDCILYDSMCIWGKIAAQVLHVPAIVWHASMMMRPNAFNAMQANGAMQMPPEMPAMFARMREELTQLYAEYHLPAPDMMSAFSSAEPLTILFIPRAFQPGGDTFDERFVFVGPSIATRPTPSDFPIEQLDNSRPTLYISLGTVFNNWPDFFNMCFEAFGNTQWQVVLSLSNRVDHSKLNAIPQNFLVANYVPQLEILQHASVFITHGGMNSVQEGIYYGVPMVAIPQMPEQSMNAQRVADLGLGIKLEKDAVTVETLREAVTRIASDLQYRAHAQAVQQQMHEAGGYQHAADAIMQYAQKVHI